MNGYSDQQNAILNQLAYVKRDKETTVKDLLNQIPPKLLKDLPENQLKELESLKIVAYEDDNKKTGFAAIAFEDSSGAVGMSFRGTEPDKGPKDMIDNAMASIAGVSPQILKALEFYEKYGKEAENVFLYGHSKGGDLALEVYVTDYNNIEQVHIINAQPIDDSKLRPDQKVALMLNKVDGVIIVGDFVGFIGIPGYNVQFVKNGVDGKFIDPHNIGSAMFDDETGKYIEDSWASYVNYPAQGAVAAIAAGLVEALQIALVPISSAIYNIAIVATDMVDKAIAAAVVCAKTAVAAAVFCKKTVVAAAVVCKKTVETVIYAAIVTVVVAAAVIDEVVSAVVDSIVTVARDVGETLGAFLEAFEFGKGIIGVGLFYGLVGQLTLGGNRIIQGICITVYGIVLILLSIAGTIINLIIDMINLVIKAVTRIVNDVGKLAAAAGELIGQDWGWHFNAISPIGKLPLPSFPKYETGGFPLTGHPFIARETGSELVGTIGSRTAVVNNEQIVDAVSRGVYGAFVSASYGKNSKASAIARVFLNGKQIAVAAQA